MASADAVSPAPATPAAQHQLQTVVLRVSIHCLGCKKKVRKVLRSIEGVKDVKVDAAMHKVTVTGTVDGDTLVKRLYKSGKQAVPWQHPHVAPVPAPEAKGIEAAPQPQAAPAGDDGGKGDAAAEKTTEEQAVKEAAQAESSEEKKTEQGGESEKKPEAEKETEKKEEEEPKPSDETKKDAGGESEAVPETKAKGGAEPELAKEAVPAEAKKASNDEDGAKEEKSKPKDAGDAAPPATATTTTTERSLHFSPPPAHKQHAAHEEHYPYPYYGTPQPVMSYHMTQPTTSVSYYAPRPEPAYSMQQHPPPRPEPAYSVQQQQYPPPSPQPQPMQQQWSPSYLYMPYPHSSPDSYYRDYYSPPGTAHAPPLQDEYRMFDDENPNACSVM